MIRIGVLLAIGALVASAETVAPAAVSADAFALEFRRSLTDKFNAIVLPPAKGKVTRPADLDQKRDAVLDLLTRVMLAKEKSSLSRVRCTMILADAEEFVFRSRGMLSQPLDATKTALNAMSERMIASGHVAIDDDIIKERYAQIVKQIRFTVSTIREIVSQARFEVSGKMLPDHIDALVSDLAASPVGVIRINDRSLPAFLQARSDDLSLEDWPTSSGYARCVRRYLEDCLETAEAQQVVNTRMCLLNYFYGNGAAAAFHGVKSAEEIRKIVAATVYSDPEQKTVVVTDVKPTAFGWVFTCTNKAFEP